MFSKELQVLDKNTVKYMIDELQEELDSANATISDLQALVEKGITQRDKEKIEGMLKKGKTPEAIVEFCDYPMKLVMEVKADLDKL